MCFGGVRRSRCKKKSVEAGTRIMRISKRPSIKKKKREKKRKKNGKKTGKKNGGKKNEKQNREKIEK